jgi:hypothetical protein
MFKAICKFFGKPDPLDLLKNELYQTEREVIGQEEHCYRFRINLAMAEAKLNITYSRREQLKKQLRPEVEVPRNETLLS